VRLCVYICACVYVCICMCMYMYVFIRVYVNESHVTVEGCVYYDIQW